MKLRQINDVSGQLYGWAHWCPACNREHRFVVVGSLQWAFDGNQEAPTFSPSMRVLRGERGDETACHYNLEKGRLTFHGDSPHALSGQTVPLPDLPPLTPAAPISQPTTEQPVANQPDDPAEVEDLIEEVAHAVAERFVDVEYGANVVVVEFPKQRIADVEERIRNRAAAIIAEAETPRGIVEPVAAAPSAQPRPTPESHPHLFDEFGNPR